AAATAAARAASAAATRERRSRSTAPSATPAADTPSTSRAFRAVSILRQQSVQPRDTREMSVRFQEPVADSSPTRTRATRAASPSATVPVTAAAKKAAARAAARAAASAATSSSVATRTRGGSAAPAAPEAPHVTRKRTRAAAEEVVAAVADETDEEETREEASDSEDSVQLVDVRSVEMQIRRANHDKIKYPNVVVDECPSCMQPLMADLEKNEIARDNTLERRTTVGCAASRYAEESGNVVRRDMISLFLGRLQQVYPNVGQDFFIPNSDPPTLKNCFLRPDIVVDPSFYERAKAELPEELWNQPCSLPKHAKQNYLSNRMAYDNQIAELASNNPSTSTLRGDMPSLPKRARCRCDVYNLERCNDPTKPCCCPRMRAIEDRALRAQM
ncbi:hypothetical protein PFISCL1PPCAC_27798, partial [Pristionchus fissidentatus]